ncbi:hypothetical protein SOM26_17315 [Sphingomonas sp. CFBP8993]|uniref:hypothetical protein n=1 Tax=Sphingomonas sp. CFBP8993 TaxID=3096526 RepID=UPI002A6A5760|nr:hypothetical protein [Sphingomonas sp. CFBP8993]MDY0960443.1 hypothetical protein [Sphingomonas sp. CFBP8993]
MSRAPLTSRDWLGKASAATILGFTLTMALTCTFAALCATDDDVFSAQRQLAMWLASPIWCAILGLCFLFRSGARAWGWLAFANLLAWALYVATRLLLG